MHECGDRCYANGCKSDTTEKAVKKKLKTNHIEQQIVKKCKTHKDSEQPKKKRKLTQPPHFDQALIVESRGLIWDGENYSCAYDALYTLLWNIWITEPSKWTPIFATLSERMGVFGEGLKNVENGILTVERLQNNIWQDLHNQFPEDFLYGYQGTSVVELVTKMFHNMKEKESKRCVEM